MKTRDKILLIMVSFLSFYFALIPALQQCMESDADGLIDAVVIWDKRK